MKPGSAAGPPGYTAAVSPAVIELDFDPLLRAGGLVVRWGTVALAVVVLLSLVVAVRRAARLGLGPDDVLFVAVGVVAGGVVGGRLGYVLAHLDFYAANPAAIVDPGQGSLSLGLGVVGGLLTGSIVAGLLWTSIRRWLHVAGPPVLLGIGLGKLALLLSGTGQGLPSDVPWAIAFRGPGPWGSLAPDVPSHPAQVYEAGVALLALLLVAALERAGLFRARDGRNLAVGLAAWAVGRLAIGTVWRDGPVVGPLAVEQVVAAAIAIGSLIGVALLARAREVPEEGIERTRSRAVEWPDPATRPRF